ncbi:MAG: flippase-like domain-containing protein [Chloroflexi bacterium]|nr:flippase-like domain-containing protein [Chloroflexota bacterium]
MSQIKTLRSLAFNIIRLVAGVTLLVLSLWGVNWGQLAASVGSISLSWFLLAIGFVVVGLCLKAIRWWLFLKNYGLDVPWRRIFEAYFAGQSANILLPARGGELVRLGLLSVQAPTNTPQVAATIALEKFLDLAALSFTAVVVAAYLPPEKALWVREWLLPFSGLASLMLLVMILWGPRLWRGIQPKIPSHAPPWVRKVAQLVDRFIESSLWLRDASRLLPALLLTALIWVIMWGTNMFLFQSLKMELPLVAGGLVLVFIYLGLLPALMPGNIGPFYFFAQLAVRPFIASDENALAFAILLHAIVTLPPLLAGGIFLLFSGKGTVSERANHVRG